MGIYLWTKPSQNQSIVVIIKFFPSCPWNLLFKSLLLSQDIKPLETIWNWIQISGPETSDIFLLCLVIQLF